MCTASTSLIFGSDPRKHSGVVGPGVRAAGALQLLRLRLGGTSLALACGCSSTLNVVADCFRILAAWKTGFLALVALRRQ